MPPKLSVILPVYNGESTLERAARSVLDSTYRDLELVLVDDGSSDASPEIARRLGRSDARVRLIHQDHLGVAAAMNRGVRESGAAILARMDADDFSLPQRFDVQIRQLESEKLDAVGGRVRIVTATGDASSTMQRYEDWLNRLVTPEAIAADQFVELPIVNPTALARREVFELGFRNVGFPEDYDFWLRVLACGMRIGKTSDVVLEWTDHDTRLTRTNPIYSKSAFRRCKQVHLVDGPLRNARNVGLWGAGVTGKPWLRWLLRQGMEVPYVVDVNPRKLGSRIHGVHVIAPEALPPANGDPVLIAVAAPDARPLIEPVLHRQGYRLGRNAWFVA